MASTDQGLHDTPGRGAGRDDSDRAGANRLWLLTFAILVVWGLHNALLLPWEMEHLQAGVREPLLLLLRALAWMVPATIYLRRHDPRPLLEALGITSPISWRGLARTAPLIGAWLGVAAFLASASAEPGSTGRSLAGTLLPPRALAMLLGAGLEELLLRGFLLRQLLRRKGGLRAQLPVAALFAVMHLPGWIALGGLHAGLAVSALVLFVLGLVLGIVTRTTGSTLPAIAVHFANNVLAEWLGP
jgi:membrane protease YdiL (CAAX protease family)